jgi:hypothetical protein
VLVFPVVNTKPYGKSCSYSVSEESTVCCFWFTDKVFVQAFNRSTPEGFFYSLRYVLSVKIFFSQGEMDKTLKGIKITDMKWLII